MTPGDIQRLILLMNNPSSVSQTSGGVRMHNSLLSNHRDVSLQSKTYANDFAARRFNDGEGSKEGEEVLSPLARQYLDSFVGYYQQLSAAEQNRGIVTSDLNTSALSAPSVYSSAISAPNIYSYPALAPSVYHSAASAQSIYPSQSNDRNQQVHISHY